MLFTKYDRPIERVDDSGSKIDKIGVIDTNNTKVSKLVRSKDLV